MGVAEIFSTQKGNAKISAPRYPFQLLVPPKQIQQRTLRGFHYYRYPNTNSRNTKYKQPIQPLRGSPIFAISCSPNFIRGYSN